ncbi:GNAT family N-acetyltransferase [Microbacterium sp. H1-D42]|uniref:GNAT family N-acetyltransferase n=1 Tax=Microbacterium sp. H1-D42 TaxID=2925844 RepID=UPI001F52FB1D|nr:GNAT family N-acetyltransferase [Microbacterium sp. H1-D42]UNK69953.1 GNAT family N-acetyltransferase [Microbacterium sp. H1-D42]
MADALLPHRTERLQLRFHEERDAADLLRVYSREDVALYLLEEPWTAEQTAERLAKRITRRTLFDEPHSLSLVIQDERGRYVGDLALWLTDVEHRQAEIGWVRDPEHPGRGYVTEAASALIRMAFTQLDVHRIAAQMDARNDASAALARRLGFRFEGHMIEDLYCKGEYTDTFVFGMLARDLPAT